MMNILRQLLKVLYIYILAFIFMYLCNMILVCITDSSSVRFMLLCILMGIGGFLFSLLIDKRNIQKNENKNIIIQIIAICVLLIIVEIKSSYQIYFPIGELCDSLQKVIGLNAAEFLTYGTMPVLNTGYFLVISIFWLLFTLTRIIKHRLEIRISK
ncbi:hypothetical protein [Blautia producta]|uniref:Uncharacterized protein n=1 Tax=Blautia producta TaxID=33035 RepID=A0A4P6M1A9_9FIRM|nr:hypothetical protein [Blautia producta]QBE98864.1 hypothetical protein PMF13cell1_04430 [Blautia producta]